MTRKPEQAPVTLAQKPTPPAWVPISISALLALITIYLLTDIFFVDVMIGLFTDGAILVAYLVAACGWGWWIVGQSPARVVTSTAIGLGVMGLVTLGLGLAGIYNGYSAIGLIVFGIATGATGWYSNVCGRREAQAGVSTCGIRIDTAQLWWLVPFSLIFALTIVCTSIMPGFLWKPLDPHPYDAISYHLQVPREWYDAGRIIPLTHNAFSYFPMGMEMHYLAAMTLRGGPWKGMYLCQMMTLAHGVLTVIAVAQIARALGATSLRAWSGALIVASVPWVFQLSVVAYVETGVMLYTTLAVGWLMLAIRNPMTRAWLIVGVLAGLACGMKYTAIPMTAGLVVGIAVVHESLKKRLVNALLVAVTCALVASPWLIRNAAWTGNPVFPLATSVFGQAHFTDDQVDRYRAAHTPPPNESSPLARVRNGWSRTVIDPQFGYLVLAAGLAAVAFLLIRKPRADGVVLAIMVVGMLVIWLGATHIIPRFLTPIVPLLGLAIALVPIPGVATASLASINLILGGYLVWGWLAPTLDIARQGLFRMSSLAFIATEETEAAMRSGQKVALIGDAQAFYYEMPSDQLIYRSVFDVHIPDGTSLVDGWVNEPIETLRKRGVWVVINTSELDRLSKTYRHLPRANAPFDQVYPRPIVLPPE